jgi:hypothetical protein
LSKAVKDERMDNESVGYMLAFHQEIQIPLKGCLPVLCTVTKCEVIDAAAIGEGYPKISC